MLGRETISRKLEEKIRKSIVGHPSRVDVAVRDVARGVLWGRVDARPHVEVGGDPAGQPLHADHLTSRGKLCKQCPEALLVLPFAINKDDFAGQLFSKMFAKRFNERFFDY